MLKLCKAWVQISSGFHWLKPPISELEQITRDRVGVELQFRMRTIEVILENYINTILKGGINVHRKP